VSIQDETIKEIVVDYGSEVMALVQKGKLEGLPELTEGATKEILARIERQFIWGQVPYHDLESGTTKEWTMRCISDEDWQDFSQTESSPTIKEEIRYPLWAKITFYLFISLWLGWLYILGGKIHIKFPSKEWKLL